MMRHMVHESDLPERRIEDPPSLAALRRMRADVEAGSSSPPALERYLAKVREHANTVTDAEVAALLSAGVTQEQIYLVTMYAAMTAGLERFEAGLRALAQAEGK
jgi:alkylhydroperoxidase family enzyme